MPPLISAQTFRPPATRRRLTAAVTLALAWPLAATAWYDIPVRASRQTISNMKAQGVDAVDLAAYLRTAADARDEDATWAKKKAAGLCQGCRWWLRQDLQGDYIWVVLKVEASEAELNGAESDVTEIKKRQPRKSGQ
jgi:hypothetical protein